MKEHKYDFSTELDEIVIELMNELDRERENSSIVSEYNRNRFEEINRERNAPYKRQFS